MIFLFTDFGGSDIYVGQVKAVLLASVHAGHVVDLLHDVPDRDVVSGAHLLAALSAFLPETSIVLAVVDPGVGGSRKPVVMQADGCWYVGPDNGLLSVLAARARVCRVWEILWRPQLLSDSFHGRDLFAPVVSMLESNIWWSGAFREVEGLQVQLDNTDLEQVIYVDHYGNAMTGIRAANIPDSVFLEVSGMRLPYARIFSEMPVMTPFWYRNSLGLVEVAVNQGCAAALLDMSPGSQVRLIDASGFP